MLLSPKRLRERAGIFAALLGVVGLVCGVTIGVLGLISAAATDGVRIGLAERSGADIAYRVSFRLAEDPVEQDRAVRAAIESSFAASSAAIVVDRMVDVRMDVARIGEPGPEGARRRKQRRLGPQPRSILRHPPTDATAAAVHAVCEQPELRRPHRRYHYHHRRPGRRRRILRRRRATQLDHFG